MFIGFVINDFKPRKRIGGGEGDADELKNHPFFSPVEWDKLMSK